MDHTFDIDATLDVTSIELPDDDRLLDALSAGVGNTEIGASGRLTKSWLV